MSEFDPPSDSRAWGDTASRLEAIYCDESSIDGARYFALGGLWVSPECDLALRKSVAAICERHGMRPTTEFKWVKVSGSKLHPAYPELIDEFCSADCRFNALVIDRQNAGRNRGDDHELDFYKSVHLLLRKRIERECAYRVILDHRTNKRNDRLAELHAVLNRSARRDHSLRRDCFREVIARDSKTDFLIQLADVLLGAICYHFNERHLQPGASLGKKSLAAYISKSALGADRLGPTTKSQRKFNVWLWDPR